MPSAGDFAAAVTQVRRSMGTVDDTRMMVIGAQRQPAIVGGPIAGLVDAGLEQAASELAAIRRLADELVAELDRRRVACERFAADMTVWRARYARWESDDRAYRATQDTDAVWPGPAPARPTPPFPGAEAW